MSQARPVHIAVFITMVLSATIPAQAGLYCEVTGRRLPSRTRLEILEEHAVGRTSVPGIIGRANQGITATSSAFYTSSGAVGMGEKLSKFDRNWNFVRDTSVDYDSRISHVGDIATDGNYLYVPVSDSLGLGEPTFLGIARYTIETLGLQDSYDVSYLAGSYTDIAGLEYHQGRLYGIEHRTAKGAHIFEFELTPTPNLVATYETNSLCANGIDIRNGQAYVSSGDHAGTDAGLIQVYDLPSLCRDGVNQPHTTFTYDVRDYHAEGLVFDGSELWVAQEDSVTRLDAPDGIPDGVFSQYTVWFKGDRPGDELAAFGGGIYGDLHQVWSDHWLGDRPTPTMDEAELLSPEEVAFDTHLLLYRDQMIAFYGPAEDGPGTGSYLSGSPVPNVMLLGIPSQNRRLAMPFAQVVLRDGDYAWIYGEAAAADEHQLLELYPTVPEPATVGLLVVGSLTLIRRKRQVLG